jgi:hypothetical protein
MFTMRDFHKIKGGIKSFSSESQFCPKKNKIAHTISCMNSSATGEAGEKLMARYLRRQKYHVRRFGNVNPFDILLDGKIKCEIKTCTMRLKANGNHPREYVIHGVKPELFDIIMFVFVTPEGIITKWSDKKHVTEYLKNRKRQGDGYYIYFDATCDNENMAYNDSMDDFVKHYKPISQRVKEAVDRLYPCK